MSTGDPPDLEKTKPADKCTLAGYHGVHHLCCVHCTDFALILKSYFNSTEDGDINASTATMGAEQSRILVQESVNASGAIPNDTRSRFVTMYVKRRCISPSTGKKRQTRSRPERCADGNLFQSRNAYSFYTCTFKNIDILSFERGADSQPQRSTPTTAIEMGHSKALPV